MKRKCKTKIIVSQVDEGMFRSIKSLQTKNINMKDGWFKQQTKERNDANVPGLPVIELQNWTLICFPTTKQINVCMINGHMI